MRSIDLKKKQITTTKACLCITLLSNKKFSEKKMQEMFIKLKELDMRVHQDPSLQDEIDKLKREYIAARLDMFAD